MWRPQLDAVSAAGWRAIAPDLRGYGETTVVPGKTPLSAFAADLAALLDHLGVADVVVCGLSMGGQIAMELARQYPHRVPALVVVGTEDAFTTREQAELMHELLTGSELVWLEGIGHMPNLESPDAFNAALIRFLTRLAPALLDA